MPNLTINGVSVQADNGMNLLQAAKLTGIETLFFVIIPV